MKISGWATIENVVDLFYTGSPWCKGSKFYLYLIMKVSGWATIVQGKLNQHNTGYFLYGDLI
jgi:hypothetical protein